MFDFLATPVAFVLIRIHNGLSTFLDPASGLAWAGSIILLTIFVRLLLFPLFVKQIKSQRRMQQIQPKVKELQKLHKGDRETLNKEMMQLYKANNANPIAGCLPLVLQLPVFFALFTVLREFKPGAVPKFGLSVQDLAEGGRASVFGAPISSALNDSVAFINGLGGNPSATRVVAIIMLITMGATTFLTQKQMMARNTSTDKTQMQVQKIMLYVLPFSFAIFGFSFPIGVLLYWLTTNVWSLGQQRYVIARMPPPVFGADGKVTVDDKNSGAGGSGPKGLFGRFAKKDAPVSLSKGDTGSPGASGRSDGSEATAYSDAVTVGASDRKGGQQHSVQARARSQQGSRKNRNRKKGRPGGRR